jgi:hypothetical protein
VEGQKQARRFAQAALGAIALDRIADFLGGGEARPDGAVRVFGSRAHLNDDTRARDAIAVACT